MDLSTYKLPTVLKEKKGEWWQEVSKPITQFFGRNCYWVFWKFPEGKVMRAWHIAQKESDHDFTHFMQNIKLG